MTQNNTIKGLLLLSLGALLSSQASADMVTFGDFDDSHNVSIVDTREMWDITTTSALDDKTLTIGVTNFTADGNIGGSNITALDTLSLSITAEAGYVITKVTYVESGTRELGASGIAVYTGSATANGQSNALGFNLFQGASDGTWNTDALFEYDAADGVQSVDFVVTNSLIAFGEALITKGAASIVVETELAPVPLPPAVWLLGSAILGLVSVRRNSNNA